MCLGAGDKRELSVLSAQFNCGPNAQKNKARLKNKRHTLNIKTDRSKMDGKRHII